MMDDQSLKSINELPEHYRHIFSSRFEYFNRIQSKLLDYLIKTDKSLVICSPTASGKTVLLELAIIKELMRLESNDCDENNSTQYDRLYALYLAPLKVIVEEKCKEWQQRFECFGLKCFSMTGDTDSDEYQKYLSEKHQQVNILLATPEKFDSIIRTHSESRLFLRVLNLIMIDEIHLLGDRNRGDFLEATITRLKFIRDNTNNIINILKESDGAVQNHNNRLRFIAISATASNVDDISIWLDPRNSLGIRVPSDWRPVTLTKLVLGIEPSGHAETSEYRFDIQITYKLESLIRKHSDMKPTLIFCSTRRSAEFTAKVLATSSTTYYASQRQQVGLFMELSRINNDAADIDQICRLEYEQFKNIDLKTTLASGVAFYHSGMDSSDRRLIEHLFSLSLIPVLVSTSSLALGVNLPAHLVIIKNTVQFEGGTQNEYDSSQILQMIGRAGRPQFDTNAMAIIITKKEKKEKYEALLDDESEIESNLFRSLIEHLMIEIVLKTVNNIHLAMEWIFSTFLFIRIVQNPSYYRSSIKKGDYEGAHPIIFEWCQQQMNRLKAIGLITIKGEFFDSTQLARIVTKYSISISTFEYLIELVKKSYSLQRLLEKICECAEISQDIIVRTTDKCFLNNLNKKIRFKFSQRFRDGSMKANCLLQSTFDSLAIEQCLNDDLQKIIRSGQRVIKCLMEIFNHFYHKRKSSQIVKEQYHHLPFQTLISIAHLSQAFWTHLWYDSPFVSKQLPGIGNVLSTSLVENGYTTFDKLLKSNPRQLEFYLKRKPPFGSVLIEKIKNLPRYKLELIRKSRNEFKFNPSLENRIESRIEIELKCAIQQQINSKSNIIKPEKHYLNVIVGCENCNQIISMTRLNDHCLFQSSFNQTIILITTNFNACTRIEESDSSKEDENRQISSSKKQNKRKKVEESPEWDDNHEIYPDSFIDFINQISTECKEFKNISIHASLKTTIKHTIKAYIISENFAGLDVETKLVLKHPFIRSYDEDLFDFSFDEELYEQILPQQDLIEVDQQHAENNETLSTIDSIDVQNIQSNTKPDAKITKIHGAANLISKNRNNFNKLNELIKQKSVVFDNEMDNKYKHNNTNDGNFQDNKNETDDEDDSYLMCSVFTKFRKHNSTNNCEEEIQKFIKSYLPSEAMNISKTTMTTENRSTMNMNETKIAKIYPTKRKISLKTNSTINQAKNERDLTSFKSHKNDDNDNENNKISKYFL